MTLLGLVALVLVVCVVVWAVYALTNAFSIGEPIRTVIYVVTAIVVLLFLLNATGVLSTNLRIR